jgi:hypothetical protein
MVYFPGEPYIYSSPGPLPAMMEAMASCLGASALTPISLSGNLVKIDFPLCTRLILFPVLLIYKRKYFDHEIQCSYLPT